MNLKQKLSKKLKKTGGFTLIEMLIVVAIIAILVAVSIPMVNANLETAREATDAANERAAKAAAMIQFMMDPPDGSPTTVYYDYNINGIATEGDTDDPDNREGYDYGQSKENKGGYVKVKITVATGVAETIWEGTPTTAP